MITPYHQKTSDSKFIDRLCADGHIGVVYTHTRYHRQREMRNTLFLDFRWLLAPHPPNVIISPLIQAI